MASRRDLLMTGAIGAGALLATRGWAADASGGPSETQSLVPPNPQLNVNAGANRCVPGVSAMNNDGE
jgi:hypothetical protein